MITFGSIILTMAFVMKLSTIFLFTVLVSLTGCTDSLNHLAYHPDIPQGNIVTQEQINKLAVGMTQSEVIQIVGTPLLTDPFHANRWDYIHRTTSTADETTQTDLIVTFDTNQKVSKIEVR